MKKILFIFLIITAIGCAQQYYEADTDNHYFDESTLFKNGCLNHEYVALYPCLWVDENGCVSREEWTGFMDIWKVRTPEPNIPLCEQL